MAQADRAVRQGLEIAATVVVFGMASALVLARLISRPLQQLTRGAYRLQDLDFGTPISVDSCVDEIATLSQAMNSARDAIQGFALYVPREVVRKAIQSGEFSSASRHEVTALFTDIYDFTTISEPYPLEEVTKKCCPTISMSSTASSAVITARSSNFSGITVRNQLRQQGRASETSRF